ncbi:MAG: hypothetical protein K6A30_03485 [Lachnospiraceae bacterium]|nr:hypothetical protein [Lachnospiraceae bacterium]
MSEMFNQVPVFENGMAQPVFPFTPGTTGKDYNAMESAVVRYCVYVETDYDMDGDGRRDLVKAMLQVPRSAIEGHYKAASVMEARPYASGTHADGYDHMKEVADKDYPAHEIKVTSPAKRVPQGCMSAWDVAKNADPSDWYYADKSTEGAFCYQDLEWYNYYLVRGFAVVLSAGRGTTGSDGFVECGGEYEKEAFKCVVEWLHGDRTAYIDREGKIETKADWSNGNVGMTGRSYAGTMPFAVATTGTPGLKTIVPVAGISDWYDFLNQQGAQRYWPQEMLASFLDYFCSSNYDDDKLPEELKKKTAIFHNQRSVDQIKEGFDYGDFWKNGNYTLNANNIQCSALIVHGFNDENVSTKQFQMMYESFKKAGATVKLLLHQGPHMTPTMAAKSYGISIDGKQYDDILNKWFSHFLYNVDNDALDMPNVLSQSNVDQHVWETEESWETGKCKELTSSVEGTTVLDTNWEKAGIDAKNFDEKMSLFTSNMNRRFITDALTKDITIQGSVRVDFKASLKEGNPDTCFDAKSVNNADNMALALGTKSGKMDDVKLTVLLCDLCEEAFDSVQTVDPERNEVPVKVVKEGGISNGGDLPNFDLVEFETQHHNYKVIERAYIDLCNPESGYEPETSKNSITLKKGEDHDYHIFLNPSRHKVVAGHKLAVVVGTEDPVNCMLHKNYEIELHNDSVKAVLPVTEEVAQSLELHQD